MEIIKQLVEKIDDELEDADKYIKCAYKVKEKYPSLADTYYKLSLEEMNHMSMLHSEVARIIQEYRKKSGEPPAAMMAVYEYLHKKHINRAGKIKAMQQMYREQAKKSPSFRGGFDFFIVAFVPFEKVTEYFFFRFFPC